MNERTLLMPTFTTGYKDGKLNLDYAPSSTGIITESFRLRKGIFRSCSAFFSFSVRGDEKGEIMMLRPRDAWGNGSIYHWMELNNARVINFGTHPTHSSYFHRLEWLARDYINYRIEKLFSGELTLNGKSFNLTESLFVRESLRHIQNDFTTVLPYLRQANFKQKVINGINISAFNSKDITDVLLPILKDNPKMLLK